VRRRGDLEQRVGRAEAHVAAALRVWRADQTSRCDECRLSLQTAIRELEDAGRDAGQVGSIAVAPLRQRLEQLQADVERLTRLVDAATAFCRGMTLTIGPASALDAIPATEGLA
jgi:hypothetical protein